jgi:hypothetical protein
MNHSFVQDITGNRKQVFAYYNGGCAYANACDISAESLDIIAIVDLLLVGDDPKEQFVLWLHGCLKDEPRIGLALAEGFCNTWGFQFG